MNILFVVSESSPFNPRQGSQQRSNLLLRACLEVGNVDVISFCENEINNTFGANILYSRDLYDPILVKLSRQEKIRRIISAIFPSNIIGVNKDKERIIDAFCSQTQYDYIVIRYALSAVHCGLYKYGKKLIVDADDDPSKIIRRYGDSFPTWRGRFFYRLYANNVQFAMHLFGKKIHRLFFSNIENVKGVNVQLLPNVPFYDTLQSTNSLGVVAGRLLFVGDMNYEPNSDGVDFFLKEVYSKLIDNISNISFHIVGMCSDISKISRWESFPNVHVLGFVPSLEKEYAEAQIAILPLKYSGGTCIKFLEAVQMGCPVVTTPSGFSGYDSFFEKGTDCIVAKDEREFADGIIKLVGDRTLRQSLVDSSVQKMNLFFSKENFYMIVKDTMVQ